MLAWYLDRFVNGISRDEIIEWGIYRRTKIFNVKNISKAYLKAYWDQDIDVISKIYGTGLIASCGISTQGMLNTVASLRRRKIQIMYLNLFFKKKQVMDMLFYALCLLKSPTENFYLSTS